VDESEQGPPPRRIRVPGFLVEQEIGLGSAIKRVTDSVGVRPCGGCQRRAAQLDRRVVLQGHRRTRATDPTTGGSHHGF
jgi:hypothetical protein